MLRVYCKINVATTQKDMKLLLPVTSNSSSNFFGILRSGERPEDGP